MKRCAVYTRKSTEEGPDQAFNSLDAQREACEAYVASQKGEGWKLLQTRFDDGGLSGGNMERPALKALLEEIEAGRVDIVVVYKVDRLTRSLADFAKLVERFDAKGVSFVSVTQQFNTSNSMGRLTLNVLLSFAQFEREVTAERIRDKIAASRKKGMWTGGNPPLGYDNIDKKLVINKEEAITVQRLFSLYRETRNTRIVLEAAKAENLTTKRRANGSGGKPITRGPLYWMLSNPIYAGLVRAGKELHEGEHEAIVDREIWNEVQAMLKRASQRAGTRSSALNPLAGKLFAEGARLTPSHAKKQSRRYRYYVSHVGETGATASADRWRVNADAIDAIILEAVNDWLEDAGSAASLLETGASAADGRAAQSMLIELRKSEKNLGSKERIRVWASRIERINISETGITITLQPAAIFEQEILQSFKDKCHICYDAAIGRRGIGLKVIAGATEEIAQPDKTAIDLIRRASRWRDRWFTDPSSTLASIAKSDGANPGDVSKHLRLAFLAPDIVKALLDGTDPQKLDAETLRRLPELPADWADQRRLLGFNA